MKELNLTDPLFVGTVTSIVLMIIISTIRIIWLAFRKGSPLAEDLNCRGPEEPARDAQEDSMEEVFAEYQLRKYYGNVPIALRGCHDLMKMVADLVEETFSKQDTIDRMVEGGDRLKGYLKTISDIIEKTQRPSGNLRNIDDMMAYQQIIEVLDEMDRERSLRHGEKPEVARKFCCVVPVPRGEAQEESRGPVREESVAALFAASNEGLRIEGTLKGNSIKKLGKELQDKQEQIADLKSELSQLRELNETRFQEKNHLDDENIQLRKDAAKSAEMIDWLNKLVHNTEVRLHEVQGTRPAEPLSVRGTPWPDMTFGGMFKPILGGPDAELVTLRLTVAERTVELDAANIHLQKALEQIKSLQQDDGQISTELTRLNDIISNLEMQIQRNPTAMIHAIQDIFEKDSQKIPGVSRKTRWEVLTQIWDVIKHTQREPQACQAAKEMK
jgi:predicted  nucleic acid-binding Zn-ribbon protein